MQDHSLAGDTNASSSLWQDDDADSLLDTDEMESFMIQPMTTPLPQQTQDKFAGRRAQVMLLCFLLVVLSGMVSAELIFIHSFILLSLARHLFADHF